MHSSSAPGVLVTTNPRDRAAGTSIWSYPTLLVAPTRTVSGSARDFYVQVDAIAGVGAVRSPGVYNDSTGADRSVTLSTAAGDLVFDVIACENAVSCGRTTQYTGAPAVTNGGYAGFSSATATGTSTVMGWTHTSGFTALAAVVFPEAGGGGWGGIPPWFFD